MLMYFFVVVNNFRTRKAIFFTFHFISRKATTSVCDVDMKKNGRTPVYDTFKKIILNAIITIKYRIFIIAGCTNQKKLCNELVLLIC